MIGSVPSKLAQLAVLPSVLFVAALTVPARHPAAARPGTASPGAPAVDAAFFAAGAAPAGAVDLTKPPKGAAIAPPGAWFQVTVVATWPDAAATERAASAVRSLLATSARHHEDPGNAGARARLLDAESAAPVTPAEAVELGRLGVTSAIGVGWPGASADAGEAVLVFGRALAVAGLKGDFAGLRPNPLAALLEKLGARVFVEGDPAVSRPALFDITFHAPDAGAAASLGAALSDYLAIVPTLAVRPPWHPAGVSRDEGRARATYTALDRAVRAVLEDPELTARWRYAPDVPVDADVVMVELQRAYHEAALAAVDRVASDRDHDPAVVEEFRRGLPTWNLTGVDHVHPEVASRRQLVTRLGALAAEVAPRGAGVAQLIPTPAEVAVGAAGRARVDERRVELGGLSFHRVGRGLPLLLDWLRRARCSDMRLDVTGAERGRDARR